MSEKQVKSPSIVSCPFICLCGVGGGGGGGGEAECDKRCHNQ